MKYTDFKGKKVPRLGFGTMRLPMDAEGRIDPQATQEMVDYAMAHGVNYFDTAYGYHGGESENYTGRALAKYPRESFFLADKMPSWLCHTSEDAPRIFEEQLKKCGVDYFDFYLVHDVDAEGFRGVVKAGALDYMIHQKEAGRIRHIGASFHCSGEDLHEILSEYGDVLEFVQLQINYYDWEFDCARDVYKVARDFNKPIIIMEPVRGGMLANPMSAEAREILDGTADSGHANYAALALKFCDDLPGILTTLSGMSTFEQLQENVNTFSGPGILPMEVSAIALAVKALHSDIIIPCTSCNYCSDCPSGIQIAEIFKMYNNAAVRGFHHIWGSLSGQYYALEKTASACVQCGACEARCPQHLKIMDLLQTVDAKYAHLREIGE